MLPDFGRSLIFESFPDFDLVRVMCRWKWVWRVVGIILTGQGRSIWRKPAPVSFCPSLLSRGLNLDRTQAPSVRRRRLTAWTMARPVKDEKQTDLFLNTSAVRKIYVHFEYLENRSRGLDVTWQPVRGDLTAQSHMGLVNRQWDAVDWACVPCDISPPFQLRSWLWEKP